MVGALLCAEFFLFVFHFRLLRDINFFVDRVSLFDSIEIEPRPVLGADEIQPRPIESITPAVIVAPAFAKPHADAAQQIAQAAITSHAVASVIVDDPHLDKHDGPTMSGGKTFMLPFSSHQNADGFPPHRVTACLRALANRPACSLSLN